MIYPQPGNTYNRPDCDTRPRDQTSVDSRCCLSFDPTRSRKACGNCGNLRLNLTQHGKTHQVNQHRLRSGPGNLTVFGFFTIQKTVFSATVIPIFSGATLAGTGNMMSGLNNPDMSILWRACIPLGKPAVATRARRWAPSQSEGC